MVFAMRYENSKMLKFVSEIVILLGNMWFLKIVSLSMIAVLIISCILKDFVKLFI